MTPYFYPAQVFRETVKVAYDVGKKLAEQGSALYEHQTVGKSIICCTDGQPADYMKKTNSGIVVKPRDYETLAKVKIYSKNNLKIVKKLGKNGRKYVETIFSVEKVGLEMKSFLRARHCKACREEKNMLLSSIRTST